MTSPRRACSAARGVCLDDVTLGMVCRNHGTSDRGRDNRPKLAAVPAWTRDGNSITTVTTRKDFRDALLYLGAVAYLAETANHHPDIAISWNKVTLTLSTHSAGGLTANDFTLARRISALSLTARPRAGRATPTSGAGCRRGGR